MYLYTYTPNRPKIFFEEGDSGWKEIRGDVFRLPENVNLFSAVIGVGIQFLSIGVVVLVYTTTGLYNPTDGGIYLHPSIERPRFKAGKLTPF